MHPLHLAVVLSGVVGIVVQMLDVQGAARCSQSTTSASLAPGRHRRWATVFCRQGAGSLRMAGRRTRESMARGGGQETGEKALPRRQKFRSAVYGRQQHERRQEQVPRPIQCRSPWAWVYV